MWAVCNIDFLYKSINWFVMAAIVALAVIPVHLHFHHIEDAAAVTHAVDLHVDAGAADHSHHDDTHILKASPDAVTKKLDGKLVTLFLLALSLSYLLVESARRVAWLKEASRHPSRSHHHLTPPLRAPPRH
jgi:hypothetical protein